MKESEIGGLTCSVARTVGILGDAWTLLIVRELFLGTRRYDDFLAYTGMAPKLLAARLRRLTDAGVVQKVLYTEKRYEYRLTPKGRDLYPVIVSITQWGDRWTKAEDEHEAPLKLTHKLCGHTIGANLVCVCCGEKLDPRGVEATQSAALRAERDKMREEFMAAPIRAKQKVSHK
ncbi:helix-turn-helix domain-containing protein [Cupriavidus sp. 2SB]|uniref:winged helix-turn-helix transcriptional regulator n=1 Tax=Cupriavidus sp. 2SB TaxID=2502199 RepID=UPI0010F8AC78|nr:helix-turn-helix domain-containing protein [Cupriavidus sp. 2SB]